MMHELAVARELIGLIEAEMLSHGAARLERVVVEYGALAGIMPEALSLAFEALLAGGPWADARLELACVPLRLKCGACGQCFGGEGREALWQPCPACGEDLGHEVLAGRELVLKTLVLA